MKASKIPKVGFDYSKMTVNVCVLSGAKRHDECFPNDPNDGQTILEWLKSKTKAKKFDIVFEPTGRYSEPLSEFFWAQPGVRLFQVNPEKFNYFQKSLDTRCMTDTKAAYSLAVYGSERTALVNPWQPKSAGHLALRDIQMFMRSANKRIVALKCQLKCGVRLQLVKDEIKREIARLESEKERWLDVATKIVKADPQLSRDLELLDSIPGIAQRTAVLLLCFVDFHSFKNARSLAAFLGLTVRKKQSGTSVNDKERMSKKGSKHIRAGLFCPVWTAIQHIPELMVFYEKLIASGKHAYVAQVACMRKVISYAFAVIRDQRPFDREYKNPFLTPI